MQTLRLAGREVARVGVGTWRMGESATQRAAEVRALQQALDLGLTVIDTAEMYADAELVVGQALQGRREQAFLVTKVLPDNASRQGTIEAAERSLRRLGTDHLDLYLLHWSGPHPFADTLAAFRELRDKGMIRAFGVSNFDAQQLQSVLEDGAAGELAANQVLYHLAARGIEWELADRSAAAGIAVMAYSPLDQGKLGATPGLEEVARRHGVTVAQVALAWTIRRPGVLTIPKAVGQDHVRENAAVLDLVLSTSDLALLDRDFPPPDRATELDWR